MKSIIKILSIIVFVFSTMDVYSQCTLSCHDKIQVSVDENCEALITIEMVLQDIDPNCTYSVRLEQLNGLSLPNPVGMDYVDKTIRASVYSNENSCETEVLIEDKLGPTIACPLDITVTCYEEFTNSFESLITDNCNQDFEVIISDDEIVDFVCDDTYSAFRTILFYAIDARGNESVRCEQEIAYTRPDLLNITFPINFDGVNLSTPSLKCDEKDIWDTNENGYPDPSETGAPMIDGFPIIPTENTFCEINVHYEDDTIQLCGDQFKILRTWTVLDWCQPTVTGINPVIDLQIIKVEDVDGPVISCPAPILANTEVAGCFGSLIVPEPTIISDCNDTYYQVYYRYSDQFGLPTGLYYSHGITYEEEDSFYVIHDLPVGRSWIYYNVYDACDNVSICSTYVNIIDDDAPTAVCDQHTVITLGTYGTARAFSETFDDGSKDNCEIVSYEVRRLLENDCSDNLYGPFVDFCCEDAGEYIMVELRVTDNSANANTCKIEIRVDDKQKPIVVCEDIIIDCKVDYLDPDTYDGYPRYEDNCDVTLTFKDGEFYENDCGTGTFYRYWTATDHQGLYDQCSQYVTISVFDPFDGDIDWPDDFTLKSCDYNDAHPEVTGYPKFETESCSFIAASHEDKLIEYTGDNCYEIWRKWKVIDWCQFDRENPYQTGSWWYTQKIYISDDEGPKLVNECKDIVVNSTSSTCSEAHLMELPTTDNCTVEEDLFYSYKVDTDLNNVYDIIGTKNSTIENIPFGLNKVSWTVHDNCGNRTRCEYYLEIKDAKAPTPYCLGGINTVLMESVGQITVWASDLDFSSFDNCDEELNFSFSPDTADYYKVYTCEELGMDTVEIWITDQSGNQDYCITMVDIQNNNNACDTTSALMSVKGHVMSVGNLPVEDVQVYINKEQTSESPMSMSAEDGSYQFADINGSSFNVISAFKNDDTKNGVTTLDLVLIQRHILGMQRLESPYDLIAADVNNSKGISASDLIIIRKLVLGIVDVFPNNKSWRFTDPKMQFIDPLDPWIFPEELIVNGVYPGEDYGLMGIKIGDVNHSIFTKQNANTKSRSTKELSLAISSDEIQLSFTKDQIVLGFQFGIEYPSDQMEILSISAEHIPFGEEHYNIKKGVINFSYDSSDGFTISERSPLVIKYRAKTNQELTHSSFGLNSDVVRAEVYDTKLSTFGLTLSTRRLDKKLSSDLELYQNSPNPFSDGTKINFFIPNSGTVKLSIVQIDGRQLHAVEKAFEKGYNEYHIDAELFATNGVFLYYIEFEGKKLINKMIKI